MSAKPPRAVDLTCVSALSLGLIWTLIWTLILDIYFWTSDLDVLKPEHLRLVILTRSIFDLFTYFNQLSSVNITLRNFVQYI